MKKSNIVIVEKQTILLNINHKNCFEFLWNVMCNIFKSLDIIKKNPLMNKILYKRQALNYVVPKHRKQFWLGTKTNYF